MYVAGKLSSLGSKGWDKQFILIKPQAGPHAEMHLLKSSDERGREEKRRREEEELGWGAACQHPDRATHSHPPTPAPTPLHPGAGIGSQRGKQTGAMEKKGKCNNVLSSKAGSSVPMIPLIFPTTL